ncbi:MAG: DUF4230 domain-containing protein [Thermoleophilia bacterium]
MGKTLRLGFVAAAAVVGLVLAMWLVSVLPSSLNPFHTRTIDRSQPPVMQSIQNLGQYRAATANLQLVVDLTKDTPFVPDFIKGERVLFVAAGTVDAGVDFSKLTPDSVTTNADRTQATIHLPSPTLFPPQVDLSRSSVVDRQRGIIDRLESVFTSSNDEHDAQVLAEKKLSEAAAADPKVLQKAKDNTTAMLTALLKSLGYTSVTVTYDAPPPS